MASVQQEDGDYQQPLGILSKLPTELRLHVFSFVLNERGVFEEPMDSSILRVCRQLKEEMYSLLYYGRILSFHITSYDFTDGIDGAKYERFERNHSYYKYFDTIPCFDQFGSEITRLVPVLDSNHPLSRSPLDAFKEIQFRIPCPKTKTTVIDTWQKIIFLTSFFQCSQQKLPPIKVIAAEGATGRSWYEKEYLTLDSVPCLYQNGTANLSLLEVLLQPFRRLEICAGSVLYQVQDRKYDDSALASLKELPNRTLDCELFINTWSLWFDSVLDEADDKIGNRLRFRRMFHWFQPFGEYVKSTVGKLSEIPESDDVEGSIQSQRVLEKQQMLRALIERWCAMRFFHPLSHLLRASAPELLSRAVYMGALRAEDVSTIEDHTNEFWMREFSNRRSTKGLPAVGSWQYNLILGDGRDPRKTKAIEELTDLFYEEPQNFIAELSDVTPKKLGVYAEIFATGRMVKEFRSFRMALATQN